MGAEGRGVLRMGRFRGGYSSCKPHTKKALKKKRLLNFFVKVTEKVAGSDYDYWFPLLKVVLS